jgi:hypothetical protein
MTKAGGRCAESSSFTTRATDVVAGRTRCRGAVASVKPAYPRQAATAAAPAAPRPAAATWPALAPPSAMRHSSISGLLPPALAAPQRAYARSDRRRGGPGGAAGVPDGAASAPARRPTGRPGGSRPAPRRSGTPSCRPRRPARARQTGPGVAVVGAVDLGHRGVQPLDGRGDIGHLERPGGHHHLPGMDGVVGGADLEPVVGPVDPWCPAAPAGRRRRRRPAGSRPPGPWWDRCRPGPGRPCRAGRRTRPGPRPWPARPDCPRSRRRPVADHRPGPWDPDGWRQAAWVPSRD